MQTNIIFEDGTALAVKDMHSANLPLRANETFRETAVMTFEAEYSAIRERFVDGVNYIKRDIYDDDDYTDEDLSDFCVAGKIVDNRDGTFAVHMHKETEAEKEIKQLDAVKEAAAVACAFLTDEQALSVPIIFPLWTTDRSYSTGDRVRFGDKLYRCLQAHASQSTWTPTDAPSLWARIDDPAEEWPAWVQPTGGHDTYGMDAKVSHKGKKWLSTSHANVWEPGVYGWVEVV